MGSLNFLLSGFISVEAFSRYGLPSFFIPHGLKNYTLLSELVSVCGRISLTFMNEGEELVNVCGRPLSHQKIRAGTPARLK